MGYTSFTHLKVASFDPDGKVLTPLKASISIQLGRLSAIQLEDISRFDEIQNTNFDLAIYYISQLSSQSLQKTLLTCAAEAEKKQSFFTPTMFIAKVDAAQLTAMMDEVIATNWYFDVIHPDHLDSLPIRVANLLKMHDHARELSKYNERISELEESIDDINQKINS